MLENEELRAFFILNCDRNIGLPVPPSNFTDRESRDLSVELNPSGFSEIALAIAA
jgi:hypothetical protein